MLAITAELPAPGIGHGAQTRRFDAASIVATAVEPRGALPMP
jgi:hypothetical protein